MDINLFGSKFDKKPIKLKALLRNQTILKKTDVETTKHKKFN